MTHKLIIINSYKIQTKKRNMRAKWKNRQYASEPVAQVPRLMPDVQGIQMIGQKKRNRKNDTTCRAVHATFQVRLPLIGQSNPFNKLQLPFTTRLSKRS